MPRVKPSVFRSCEHEWAQNMNDRTTATCRVCKARVDWHLVDPNRQCDHLWEPWVQAPSSPVYIVLRRRCVRCRTPETSWYHLDGREVDRVNEVGAVEKMLDSLEPV